MITAAYVCAHCGESFASSSRLGGHVHARHPEHQRALPKFLRTAPIERRRGSSLKRDTDSWPGKP
jgi:hypothetical protein